MNNLPRKIIKVGDTEVAIVMIPTISASILLKDVAQVAAQLGGPYFKVMGLFGKLGPNALEADVLTVAPDMGATISAALAGIESSKLELLLQGLLATSEVRINGAWLPLLAHVDDVFRGRVTDLYRCLLEAVRFNYPDFIDRLVKYRQDQPVVSP